MEKEICTHEPMKGVLERLIQKLTEEDKIFSNEQDFQFELGLLLQKEPTVSLVKLEAMSLNEVWQKGKNYPRDSKEYTDILVKTVDGKWYAIELKNKNVGKTCMYECEAFGKVVVMAQGAEYANSYAFWKDVERLEKINSRHFANEIKIEKGFAIFLTNDRKYRAEPFNEHWKNFSMNDGLNVGSGNFCPQKPVSIGKNKLKAPEIRNSYKLEWHDYDVEKYKYDEKASRNSMPGFSYLLLEVDPVCSDWML